MAGSCCSKPIAKIIKVGTIEAGIVGLDIAMQEVFDSHTTEDEETAALLLSRVKRLGNYIAPTFERAYKEALLREFKIFCTHIAREK